MLSGIGSSWKKSHLTNKFYPSGATHPPVLSFSDIFESVMAKLDE